MLCCASSPSVVLAAAGKSEGRQQRVSVAACGREKSTAAHKGGVACRRGCSPCPGARAGERARPVGPGAAPKRVDLCASRCRGSLPFRPAPPACCAAPPPSNTRPTLRPCTRHPVSDSSCRGRPAPAERSPPVPYPTRPGRRAPGGTPASRSASCCRSSPALRERRHSSCHGSGARAGVAKLDMSAPRLAPSPRDPGRSTALGAPRECCISSAVPRKWTPRFQAASPLREAPRTSQSGAESVHCAEALHPTWAAPAASTGLPNRGEGAPLGLTQGARATAKGELRSSAARSHVTGHMTTRQRRRAVPYVHTFTRSCAVCPNILIPSQVHPTEPLEQNGRDRGDAARPSLTGRQAPGGSARRAPGLPPPWPG